VLRYREIELLEFPNAAMWRTDNVQLHTSRLFRSLYYLPFTYLSPLLISHTPHQPTRDPIPLLTPRILPTMFAVLLRLLFRGLLRLLLLRLLLSLRSSFLPLLVGVLVRFVPEDVSVVDAANVFLAHDAVLGPEEE
jgi:hypothetical protein